MNNPAYELGIKIAMVDAGLMKEGALKPMLAHALGGAALGGGIGAATAPEGKMLQRALLGGVGGAGLGALGGAALKRLKNSRNLRLGAGPRPQLKAPAPAEGGGYGFSLGDPSNNLNVVSRAI